jgi:hypothetical protein
MPRLDVLDEEFGEDAAAVLHARRRRIGERLLMLAIVTLGLGAIGALAFAWSNADGPLRFELQSAAIARKSGQRAAAQEEIERLRGELDALKNDVKELTEAHGAYHRDYEGGRGGLATRCSASVLVLEPGDVGLGHRKPTAMGQRRAAAPPPGDRALRIARSAQARGRCASIAGGISAVTTRARRCHFRAMAAWS